MDVQMVITNISHARLSATAGLSGHPISLCAVCLVWATSTGMEWVLLWFWFVSSNQGQVCPQ